ncbi:hypothetical protein [Chamaesiphon sp.]|uniref:hypothetical protein n=1 Tax=Chamaesiphon sp. TaxID=2814140 RepID=UPI0035930327
MIKLYKTYFIDQVFPGVALKYEFYADELYFDLKAIKIRYRIFSIFSHYQDISLVAWSGVARDNFDNNYECLGGVCDPFDDGTHTEGVISFTPLLSRKISRLDFALISEGINLVIEWKFAIDF